MTQGVETLTLKPVTLKGCRVGHGAEPHGRPFEQSGAAVLRSAPLTPARARTKHTTS